MSLALYWLTWNLGCLNLFRARNSWAGCLSLIHMLARKMEQGITGLKGTIVRDARWLSRFLSKPGRRQKMLTVCRDFKLLIRLEGVQGLASAQWFLINFNKSIQVRFYSIFLCSLAQPLMTAPQMSWWSLTIPSFLWKVWSKVPTWLSPLRISLYIEFVVRTCKWSKYLSLTLTILLLKRCQMLLQPWGSQGCKIIQMWENSALISFHSQDFT
jgi:hypothetical protein